MIPAPLRTALTLAVLALLLLVGFTLGLDKLTAPLPQSAPRSACTSTQFNAGQTIFPDQVLIDVLNAGTREGLAGLVLQQYTDAGFAAGTADNAPRDVTVGVAQIWARDADDPAVRLVLSRLPKGTEVVDRAPVGNGVTVVVGNGYQGLRKGQRSMSVEQTSTLCVPPNAG